MIYPKMVLRRRYKVHFCACNLIIAFELKSGKSISAIVFEDLEYASRFYGLRVFMVTHLSELSSAGETKKIDISIHSITTLPNSFESHKVWSYKGKLLSIHMRKLIPI